MNTARKPSLQGRQLHRIVNLLYAAVYVVVMLIQFADPPASINKFPYPYVWAAGAVLYPVCLSLVNAGRRFWMGLLTILLISVLAQAVEVTVYLIRTGEYRYGDTDTVVVAGFYLIVPLAIATICYPFGYLASRLLVSRKAQ